MIDPMAAANLYRLAFGFVPAQMIHAAVRLRLPDLMTGRTTTAEELAARTETHAPTLRRLLRGLASIGVLEAHDGEGFRLAPAGELLRSDVAGSVRPMLMPYFHEALWASWGRLTDCVRTGRPSVETVTAGSVFDLFAADPELGAEFHAAMAVSSGAEAQALAQSYDFADVGTVVDLGGGNGTLLAGILGCHPHLRGILVDTPVGVAGAPDTLTAAGVADRCDIAAQDFFASVPDGGDRYVIKSVLHDWDDERCVKLLGNCRRVMSDSARVLIVEVVAPPVVDTTTDPFLTVSDLNLMVLTHGRERTETEFIGLLRAAGLELTGIGAPLGFSGYRVIEARTAAGTAE
ncbi:acetylserotonin O-methyltransferase [Streptomyces cyanogenus]|uniref:Multifunctional cyclase-dehydratase-3-O-methyl transferase TcmN n=1 Tax=Streptomyces cyanogenus TaxID=80860 RepID=A0ABX7U2Q0_STRCY|nr:acetylserotonin O-methyltransferase [Streptomyces cyanogenus]QTE03042.1 Multifunctional cyclase-dehydratase-3-O-methyl transferase TcmN [Streptomyces cyanogenus]